VPVIRQIYAEGLKKTAENFCRDIQSPGRDLYPDPPKHEAAPTTVPQFVHHPLLVDRIVGNVVRHELEGLGRKRSWHIK